MVVGAEAEDEMVNGDVSTTASDADQQRVRRQDVIIVSGKQQDCEAACCALRVSQQIYSFTHSLIDASVGVNQIFI